MKSMSTISHNFLPLTIPNTLTELSSERHFQKYFRKIQPPQQLPNDHKANVNENIKQNKAAPTGC